MQIGYIPKRKVIFSISIIVFIEFSMLLLFEYDRATSDFKQLSYAAGCNCTMDEVSSDRNNLTGVTLPRITIIKNETLESQTEGPLIWTAVKSAPLMDIITNNFLLGNLTGGTSVTVALNTINVTSKGSLGIQVAGGTPPNTAKAEIVKVSSLNENATLRQVKLGEKVFESQLEPDTLAEKAAPAKNTLTLDIPNSGYYLLVISLSYEPSNISNAKQLTGIYETLLKVQ